MRAMVHFYIEVDCAEELSALIDYLKARQIDFRASATMLAPNSHQAQKNPLTPTERRLLCALLHHDTIEAAAREMYISPHTARKHLEHIYRKLGVHSLHHAIALAICRGYLPSFAEAEPEINDT
jgi:DNA-binding CsgD family transcriptional regulator